MEQLITLLRNYADAIEKEEAWIAGRMAYQLGIPIGIGIPATPDTNNPYHMLVTTATPDSAADAADAAYAAYQHYKAWIAGWMDAQQDALDWANSLPRPTC